MSGFGLGALEFSLMADLLPLKRDMDQAQSLVGGALGGIRNTFTNMLGGLAAGLGVAAFAGWIRGAIDAGDATKQFSQKTGIASRDVAGLQLAFKQGGVEGDALTMSMAKLGKQVVEGNKAFSDLGVSTRNTDGTMRSSKDVLYDLADSFAGMEDGARKSALAQEIFGKSGATMIPTLNEGSEGMRKMADMAERLGMVIDKDTAEAADSFNDTVELLGMSTQGMGRQVAAQLLPTLKSLAGTLLDNVTSGDKLKKGADILAGGLKLLFTGGAIGVEVFSTLGKTVAGVAGALVAVAQGEFGQAWKILEESGRDIKQGWGDTAKTIEDAWTGAGGTTVDQATAMTRATNRTTVATKEQAAEAKKHAEEVAKLTKAGNDYLAGLDAQLASVTLELDLGRSLTDSEKAQLKLEEQLREGKFLLTDAGRASAAVTLLETEAKRVHLQLLKDLDKIQAEAILKSLEDSAGIAEQARRQREHNEAIGLTAAGLRTLESRRLDDSLATAEQALQQALLKGISADELEGITLMVEELRGLKKAKEEGWAKDAGLEAAKAAKDAADEWKKMVDGVQAGLTDALMRAFENGKGFLDAFRSVLLSAFQTLILKPMVQSMVDQMAGGLKSGMGYIGQLFGVPGATAAPPTGNGAPVVAGGAGGAAMSNPAYGWAVLAAMQASLWHDQGFDAASARGVSGDVNRLLGGGLLGGLGGYAMGGWQADLSHGLSKLGLNEKWADILSSATGFSAIFGVGDAKTQSTGVTGQFGSTGFTGRQFADWKAEGGLLRSDKKGTQYSEIDQELAWQMSGAAKSLLAHVTEYASALSLPVTALSSVTSDARIVLGEDAAANEKAIADALDSYGQALVRSASGGRWPFINGELSQFSEHGETALDTLNRLGGSLLGVNGIFETLGLSLVDASLAGGQAASELIALTGGLDAFATKTASYLAAYYTQGEQGGIGAKAILQTLSDAGIDASAFTQRGDLRALMDSLDPNVTGDRTQMAALLNVQAEFAKLTDYLAETGQTLGALAALAPQSPLLTRGIDPVEQSNALLQTANDNLASIAGATQANTTELQALVAVQSTGIQAIVERLMAIADGLADAQRGGHLADLAQA